ncbi:hypothetical protein BJ508DRAFT_126482 [Ascobolus immersus RN42]|uniref:Uncharacterized protein n=1 Tax=Ascobolus immersus RN42 TaxID=1160509 RepID=A0A3N4I581_ASCIM|nr:hypothetical protein BJ508DRAFT_126482 [Ascobolus immersus RN42]
MPPLPPSPTTFLFTAYLGLSVYGLIFVLPRRLQSLAILGLVDRFAAWNLSSRIWYKTRNLSSLSFDQLAPSSTTTTTSPRLDLHRSTPLLHNAAHAESLPRFNRHRLSAHSERFDISTVSRSIEPNIFGNQFV